MNENEVIEVLKSISSQIKWTSLVICLCLGSIVVSVFKMNLKK